MILKLVMFWIQILGFLWFLLGFFPLKTPLKGDAPSIREEEEEFPSLSLAWKRRVGQVVIVVVDALRADFSYSTFTSLGLVARVSCPTVTLPRIKAISTALMEDSLIKRWRDASRNIVYYGDDTWIKLFPDSFLRNEGTSSFFVSDFHQVDDNVTRNLPHEFEKSDWDVMILHYLGLDHIGHVFADSRLRKKGWKDDFPPLILVLGDHGMADIGGHGGSTIPETITPVIALSPIFNASQSLGSSKVISTNRLGCHLVLVNWCFDPEKK
ncbi:PIGG [Lepeophtheirus salmonis]|uniref:PIGG n=1 Tax=Lepeophtheirus salmonis TaxID=72036 RepID=A0A7R8D334_LEPSM|nr:PIGG [Lepeophtheirus salmonis]CAF2979820.1 PIGG [Lepeophtheirus salmonis]